MTDCHYGFSVSYQILERTKNPSAKCEHFIDFIACCVKDVEEEEEEVGIWVN